MEQVRQGVRLLAERGERYALYHDYYRGRHRTAVDLTGSATARHFRDLVATATENLCKPVVRCFAERLAVTGWQGDRSDEAEALWGGMGLSSVANRVHTDALKCGDGYLLVWPGSDGEPGVFRQDPRTFVAIHDPDDPDRIVAAVKVLRRKDHIRINVYLDDACYRFTARTMEAASQGRVSEWTGDEAGSVVPHPFGRVPVVRFAHDCDDVYGPGTSLLEDVVPLQDVLNKAIADMLITSEFFALPMRIFTGVEDEIDPLTGKSRFETFDPRKDRTLFFGGTETKAVQLPAGDLRQVMEVTDSIAQKIARVSGVPLHYLLLGTGSFPSGEALRTAEARLVSRVSDLQDEWSGAWSDLMTLLGIEGVVPRWADPARIALYEELEALEAKKRLGVPWDELMRGLGYSDEEVEALRAEKESEVASAGEAFGRAFDAGVE